MPLIKRVLFFCLPILSFVGQVKSEIIYSTNTDAGNTLKIYSTNTTTNETTLIGSYDRNNGTTYANEFYDQTGQGYKQYNDEEKKIYIFGAHGPTGEDGNKGTVDYTRTKYMTFDVQTKQFSSVQELSGTSDPEYRGVTTLGWASKSNVTTNASNISSNDTDISTNAANISSNDTDISTNAANISSNDTDISGLQSLISTKSGSTTTARIGDSTKNILEIGPTTNPTTINQSGISVSGGNLIKKDSDGNIHIGKNSFVIGNEVLNGAHPIWAEDENGSKIPLNIYGSDLHINGKSVQGQIDNNKSNINNLGSGVAGSTALTAALTALPQTSKESKHSCGIGSGAYSSRYAVGFGCASKVNERVDINAGGSYVFGGSKSYGGGTLDSGVVKAGFVFKLGELNKSQKISKTEKENLESKIGSLEEKNKQLLARLERLEKIALGDLKSKDLAVYKLQ